MNRLNPPTKTEPNRTNYNIYSVRFGSEEPELQTIDSGDKPAMDLDDDKIRYVLQCEIG